ncbi:MAG: hypothetical protein WCD35_14465, partial [Mycobacteriales bacterium]
MRTQHSRTAHFARHGLCVLGLAAATVALSGGPASADVLPLPSPIDTVLAPVTGLLPTASPTASPAPLPAPLPALSPAPLPAPL